MKIMTPLQLALIACCCRSFTLLSRVCTGSSPALFMISLAALSVVEAALLLPCLGIIKRTGKAPVELLYEKNKFIKGRTLLVSSIYQLEITYVERVKQE